jgi:hypothetical protein
LCKGNPIRRVLDKLVEFLIPVRRGKLVLVLVEEGE